ncbi:MAG: SGNH/GDSL hydrolase family protein [Mycobacteriales bacterium]
MTVRSFVALGDSFTEGLQDDPGPDGRHRGWADRVAAGLAVVQGQVRYANLAVRGRLLDQVVADQLPMALRLAPDLVSFHAGANDVLRPRTDLPALLRRYEDAVGGLRSAGIRTLLFTVVERTGRGRTADLLAARFGVFNAGIRAAAERHDADLVDLAAVPVLSDRRLFHADRLHLAPEGHARVAAAVLEALGVTDPHVTGGAPGWWQVGVPGDPATSRRADLVSDVRWVGRHLLPWIGRRVRGVSSGDRVLAKHAELVDVLAPRSG